MKIEIKNSIVEVDSKEVPKIIEYGGEISNKEIEEIEIGGEVFTKIDGKVVRKSSILDKKKKIIISSRW